jgi:hypothetical protein
MSRTATMLLVLVLVSTAVFAQLTSVATHNSYQTKATWTGPDSTKPYRNDQGIRSAWVTKDMDKDGAGDCRRTIQTVARTRVRVRPRTS